jgi:acyl carrier protein
MEAQRAEILRRLQAIMSEMFELDQAKIVASARLKEDLGLDSLDALDLAVKLEEITGFALEEKQLHQLRTVEDVIVAVDALIGARGFVVDPGRVAAVE